MRQKKTLKQTMRVYFDTHVVATEYTGPNENFREAIFKTALTSKFRRVLTIPVLPQEVLFRIFSDKNKIVDKSHEIILVSGSLNMD